VGSEVLVWGRYTFWDPWFALVRNGRYKRVPEGSMAHDESVLQGPESSQPESHSVSNLATFTRQWIVPIIMIKYVLFLSNVRALCIQV
jgi:hypothetical protein